MHFQKKLLEDSADKLLRKAENCFDLAKTQHQAAEVGHDIAARQLDTAARQKQVGLRQHENADKLDTNADKLVALGHALETDAVDLKGEAEEMTARTSPRIPLEP